MSEAHLKPIGPRIRELRKQVPMTQEELATKAKLSKKTIERVERSLPAIPCTIRNIAGVLSVHPTELYEQPESFEIPAPFNVSTDGSAYPADGDMRVTFELGHDFDAYTPEQFANFGKYIAAALKTHGEIKLRHLGRGSVLITVDLSAADAERLADMVNDEQFLQHGALRATKIALGRKGGVTCHNALDWTEKQIAKRLGIKDCDIDPRDTFGMLGVDDNKATDFIMRLCSDYQITDSLARFEEFVRSRYKLKNVDSWSYVPIGELCDFVHVADARSSS
jgi:transcriptional regulator with XRE-family HTH domain